MQGVQQVDTTVHSPQAAFGNVQRGHWEVQPEEIKLGSKIGHVAFETTIEEDALQGAI